METGRAQTDSTDSTTEEPTLFLVDDEPAVVDAYASILETEYTVLTETNGSDALDRIDGTVDLVFLDRRMPEMSGDELLAKLRQRGYEMPVSMLTAVEPAKDIVDMPFDDYLIKPVDRDELFGKVSVLLNRAEFDDTSRKFYRIASKKAALEANGIDASNRETHQELVQRMEELRDELDETLDELFDDDPGSAFRGI